MTLTQISTTYELDEDTKVLKVLGKEIGFIYFRTGFLYEDHIVKNDPESPVLWFVREALELSMTIKLPSVDIQLTTFKKIQAAM